MILSSETMIGGDIILRRHDRSDVNGGPFYGYITASLAAHCNGVIRSEIHQQGYNPLDGHMFTSHVKGHFSNIGGPLQALFSPLIGAILVCSKRHSLANFCLTVMTQRRSSSGECSTA
jgi:hypothetical protein